MAGARFLVENFYNARQFGSHTVAATSTAGNESVSGNEPFRVSTGRRHSRDHFTSSTANAEILLTVTCDRVRAADTMVLDRGHNLNGQTVRLRVSNQAAFTTYTEIFSVTVPSVVQYGNKLGSSQPVRTQEGAIVIEFDEHAGKYWRLVVDAMGANTKPRIVGLWLGKAWTPNNNPKLPWDDEGGSFAMGAQRIPKEASVNILVADESEWSEARYHLQSLFWQGYPMWYVPDTAMAERSWLSVSPDGGYSAPYVDRNARTLALRLREHQPELV